MDPELAEAISAIFPGIRRLFMSGYAVDVISQHGQLDPEAGFIQKPFSRESLLTGVRIGAGARLSSSRFGGTRVRSRVH